MKKTVSVLGVALLMGVVALAQTSSTATSSKSSKKRAAAPASAVTQGSSDTATTPTSSSIASQPSDASTNSASSPVKAGNSGFDDVASATASTSTSTSSSSEAESANASSTARTASPDSSSTMGDSDKTSATRSGAGASPAITNGPVAETVADTTVLIGWATNDAAGNTGVKYGTNRANLTETAQGADGSGKNHHARLHGLQPNTQYYFQVTEDGSPVGGVGTFKTTASGETPVQSKAVIPQK